MASGGIETEIKLRVPDAAEARRLIEQCGYTMAVPRLFESNSLFDTPERTLRQRGQLIRVRRAGVTGVLTFKAPGAPGRHKTRAELETQISDPAAMESILQALGLTLAFQYEKYRTEFRRANSDGVVTLDETPIGAFLEIEGSAAFIDSAARELGFQESAYILSSYGVLYHEYCRKNGLTPANMTF